MINIKAFFSTLALMTALAFGTYVLYLKNKELNRDIGDLQNSLKQSEELVEKAKEESKLNQDILVQYIQYNEKKVDEINKMVKSLKGAKKEQWYETTH